jgi:protein-disulfide isomerase
MRIRRDGESVAVVLKASHLTAVGIALAGALGGAALFFGVKAIGVFPDLGSMANVTLDSAAWWEAPRFEVTTDDRPNRGPSDAAVTIVEFTDYGCPFCRRHATEVLPDLLERYGDTIRYAVRHFPIPALTPNALAAADAAECAHRQGRFWEYRKALFRETGLLSAEVLQGKAVALGLDTESFGRCLADPATRDVVEGDILDAWAHGVTGTPTFFINGRRFVGARPLEELEFYVGLALQKDGS